MKKIAWEKSPQKLIDSFYHVMESFPDAELRKMFGYPCAFFNGNMFVGLHEDNLAVRLDVEEREKALQEGWGNVFAPMAGRVMKEYVALSEEMINSKDDLREVIEKSFNYVKTIPARIKKEKTKSISKKKILFK
jgi:TfoX/Sxy family transcriptional regulator of competence genes